MKYHIKQNKRLGGYSKVYWSRPQSYCNRYTKTINFIEDAYRRTDGRYVLTIDSICTACKKSFIRQQLNIKQ